MCCRFLETAIPPLRATSFRVAGSIAAVPLARRCAPIFSRSTGRPSCDPVGEATGGVVVSPGVSEGVDEAKAEAEAGRPVFTGLTSS